MVKWPPLSRRGGCAATLVLVRGGRTPRWVVARLSFFSTKGGHTTSFFFNKELALHLLFLYLPKKLCFILLHRKNVFQMWIPLEYTSKNNSHLMSHQNTYPNTLTLPALIQGLVNDCFLHTQTGHREGDFGLKNYLLKRRKRFGV